MPDPQERIQEARNDLRELRRGGLTDDIRVTSVDQQLDKLEKAADKYGNNRDSSILNPKISKQLRQRLESRITKAEQRIEKIRQRVE